MDVRGTVKFDGNAAVFGAGVAMSGRSLVRLAQSLSLTQALYRLLFVSFIPRDIHAHTDTAV
jgi:hypothetical protein